MLSLTSVDSNHREIQIGVGDCCFRSQLLGTRSIYHKKNIEYAVLEAAPFAIDGRPTTAGHLCCGTR